MSYPVGVDCSKYNLGWNPDTAKKPIYFVIQRAGYGSAYGCYKDEAFEVLNVQVSKLLIKGAYWYYSSKVNWKTQADFFLNVVRSKSFQFYCVDYEKAYNVLNGRTTAELVEFVKYIKEQTGKKCLVYFNPSVYNEIIKPAGYTNWVNKQDIWIAQYPFSLGQTPLATKPSLPSGITNWTFWQYGGGDINFTAGRHAGADYGGGLEGIDLNYFNGTLGDLVLWLDGALTPEPPTPPASKPAKVIVSSLSVRNGPGTNFTWVGSIKRDDVVNVFSEHKDTYGNIWAKLSENRYACMVYRGAVYLKYIVPGLVVTFTTPSTGSYLQTLHDYESIEYDYLPRSIPMNYKDGIYSALPETINVLGDKNKGETNNFIPLPEEWQRFWFSLLKAVAPDKTEAELIIAWKSLIADHRALTDNNAPENGYCDYVTGRNLGQTPFKINHLTMGGNLLKVVSVSGTRYVVEALDVSKSPPSVEVIWSKPWLIHWATQETIVKLANGYKVIRFPQLSPYGTPFPFMSFAGTNMIEKKFIKQLSNSKEYNIYN